MCCGTKALGKNASQKKWQCHEKGQISIEFILIVTIAFVYIGATVLPIATDSAQAAFDVKAVADTKLSATKMVNALNEAASSSGDMKKTVSIVLPEDSNIGCNGLDSKVSYDVNVTSSGGNPDEMNCIPSTELGPTGNPRHYTCHSSVPILAGAGTPFSIIGPIFKQVIVKNENGVISVS